MLHATHSFSTTRTIAQVGREMVSWKSYGIVERDVSNKDFSRSIITGSENRGGRKRKVLLCCIYTPISCSISIAGTDHRFFFFFFLPSETRWSMARQFVCKSDGRSTIKNSELRKFDPVRAFLKVPGELLSFSSLVVSDPTTVILVPFFFLFFSFLFFFAFERDKISCVSI